MPVFTAASVAVALVKEGAKAAGDALNKHQVKERALEMLRKNSPVVSQKAVDAVEQALQADRQDQLELVKKLAPVAHEVIKQTKHGAQLTERQLLKATANLVASRTMQGYLERYVDKGVLPGGLIDGAKEVAKAAVDKAAAKAKKAPGRRWQLPRPGSSSRSGPRQ